MIGWIAFALLLVICWSFPAWPDGWRRGIPAMLLHGPGQLYRQWRRNR